MTKTRTRTYEVVLNQEVSTTYRIDAEDDADLINLWQTHKLTEKGEVIKTDITKTLMNNWKQIYDNKSE